MCSSPPGFSNRAFSPESSSQSEGFHGQQGVYTRRHSLLPPPSSSSNIFIRDPAGRPRHLSELLPVTEKPEGPPEATETYCLALRKTGVSTGVSTGVHSDDITATLQRDDDTKTDQLKETLQKSEDT